MNSPLLVDSIITNIAKIDNIVQNMNYTLDDSLLHFEQQNQFLEGTGSPSNSRFYNSQF